MCRIYRPIGAASGSSTAGPPCGDPLDDAGLRATVADAASDEHADRYALFELQPTEVRCEGRGDVTLPERGEWSSDGSAKAAPPDRWRQHDHGQVGGFAGAGAAPR